MFVRFLSYRCYYLRIVNFMNKNGTKCFVPGALRLLRIACMFLDRSLYLRRVLSGTGTADATVYVPPHTGEKPSVLYLCMQTVYDARG